MRQQAELIELARVVSRRDLLKAVDKQSSIFNAEITKFEENLEKLVSGGGKDGKAAAGRAAASNTSPAVPTRGRGR